MNKSFIFKYLFIISVFFSSLNGYAQEEKKLSEYELADYKSRVEQLISFLEFTLNTIGNNDTPTKEKEIIINQSYLKIFADDEVQIEDDLDENREVVTNKDVQAYLKDIDFFFKNVSFEFNIEEINQYVNDQGQIYFRVALNRNLNGVTINDDTVNSVKPRFIEVNLHEEESDLKIASIYTTKLSEKEELANWWNNLSFEWQSVFKRHLGVYDTIDYQQLQNIIKITKLDVSDNEYIDDLRGIGKLKDLKELDISRTKVDNLIPLRNLTNLLILKCSETKISSLEPLKYASNLEKLICNRTQVDKLDNFEKYIKLREVNLAHTPITDIENLKYLNNLNYLNISNTLVTELDHIDSLYHLRSLNIANTPVTSLEQIKNLVLLEEINFSGTHIREMEPLSSMTKLRIIVCNNTPVSELSSLNELSSLERIYCDGTLITKIQANHFMKNNPNVLVIFKSDLLSSWWDNLSDDWKKIFRDHILLDSVPQKEQLAQLAQVDEIDLSGFSQITSLKPLQVMENVRKINCSGTGISDLNPIRELENLEELNCAGTNVSSLAPLGFLRELKVLNIENTKVNSLLPVLYHAELRYLYCDNIQVEKAQIEEFAEKNKDCLVIYKSEFLKEWWTNLSDHWKMIFKNHLSAVVSTSSFTDNDDVSSMIPCKEDLHKIANLRIISFQNNYQVNELNPLKALNRLKNLHFSNTGITNIEPVSDLISLESLNISENPISNISSISGLKKLKYLNIANTAVEDIDPVAYLPELEEFDCSGTQIKNLKPLSGLYQLQFLNCSNTLIRNLNPVEDLSVKKIICYNTRLSQRRIEKFVSKNPDTDIKYY